MNAGTLKVGELARQTGLTVRTLHWYEKVGLLRPARGGDSDVRMYGALDVERLQQIQSLKSLGLSLSEIGTFLEGPDSSLAAVLALHHQRVAQKLEALHQLDRLLHRVREGLALTGSVSVENLLKTIEVMHMYEKYFTPEQLKELEERRVEMGEETMRKAKESWKTLIAEVLAEMDAGGDPAGERAVALARRWRTLVEGFTGGDPGLTRSLKNLYRENPGFGRQYGAAIPGEMFDFIARATEHIPK